MSKLNERYTDVMKDVIAALLPLITKVTSEGLDDPNVKNMTEITLKSVALGGDLMQAIDDLQKNNELLKKQLDRLEETANNIKQENFRLNEKMLDVRNDVKKDIHDAYANCVALYNNIDTRIDGVEAMILEPEKFKKEKTKKDNN